jgi:hypothetical protein
MSKIGKRVSIVVLVSLVFVELGLINPILADDWPQWLGPQRLPVWNEEDIVDEFPKQGPPLRWKAELGGGYSVLLWPTDVSSSWIVSHRPMTWREAHFCMTTSRPRTRTLCGDCYRGKNECSAFANRMARNSGRMNTIAPIPASLCMPLDRAARRR